ncbi:AtpZ/AtpI family protein [Proteiniborus sp.]|uniref:AtpZ/AtpI family protein n=1 Tax=Proteiniborus sp. TaxID=2079015 RepID=UPI00332EAA8F
MNQNEKSKALQNLVLISQVGISMIVPILLGTWLGITIDRKLGTGIIFFIIFIILGIISAFVTLFKITAGSNKRK